MPIELTPADLQYLESLLNRKPRPTRRQRAKALWLLARGHSSVEVSQIVGISKGAVAAIERQFAARGIGAIEQQPPTSASPGRGTPGIEKTENVCGGSARIAGTRIPVWQLVAARDLGASEAQLLRDYPGLRAEDLVNAWSYARAHRGEIEAEIRENEVVAQ
jgi:uncharacterized protein (DUF433 family)